MYSSSSSAFLNLSMYVFTLFSWPESVWRANHRAPGGAEVWGADMDGIEVRSAHHVGEQDHHLGEGEIADRREHAEDHDGHDHDNRGVAQLGPRRPSALEQLFPRFA